MKLSAKVSICGTTPLLMHAFPLDALTPKKQRGGTTGNYHEEWKKTVLMNEKRELYLNATYFFASFKNGAKYIKEGRGNLSPKLASTLIIPQSKIYLDSLVVPPDEHLTQLDTEPVYLDVHSVVNPMTKGRNVRYRIACRKGWTTSVIIQWDDYVISKESMKLCAENAGMFSGLGDGRSIGFGRYEITSFSMI